MLLAFSAQDRFNLYMQANRRQLLRGLATLAAGSAAGAPRALSGLAAAGIGTGLLAEMPRPSERLHGLSSVDMVLRFGDRSEVLDVLAPGGPGMAKIPGLKEAGALLRQRYADLHRHFVFEYYPWYASDPYRHWQQWNRQPPLDVAATSMPLLGPYDSRDRTVLQRHARWIRDTGIGAINLSWWGRGSYEDGVVHTVMDVMADHDIKVAFHLEPYANHRASNYASDIVYLLREFGDKRGWDCFLMLRDARGKQGPVFKSFRTILVERVVDCHGVEHVVPDYTPDDVWARELEKLRGEIGSQFDQITLLADSLNMNRTLASGFDGIAIYANMVTPNTWAAHTLRAADRGLVASFNCNPGYDSIARRVVEPDSCYVPDPFHPPAEIDWSRESGRERARVLAEKQIRKTLANTIGLQVDSQSLNWQSGFFLVYINSFNEWHEGHAFEPARDAADLTAAEAAFGYHNAVEGDYRLRRLRRLLRRVLER